mgnify:CR=1 FL=1
MDIREIIEQIDMYREKLSQLLESNNRISSDEVLEASIRLDEALNSYIKASFYGNIQKNRV